MSSDLERLPFHDGAQRIVDLLRSLLRTRDASLQLAAWLVWRRVLSHRAHHGVPIFFSESRGTGWLSAAAACEVMSTRRALWPWVCFRAARRASCAGCGEPSSKATHARLRGVNRRPSRGCWRGMRSASFCTCRRASDEPFGQTVGEFDGLWWEGRWHGQRAPFAAPALVHSLGGDCLAGSVGRECLVRLEVFEILVAKTSEKVVERMPILNLGACARQKRVENQKWVHAFPLFSAFPNDV